MKQETTKCRECSGYLLIPLFEGQLNVCQRTRYKDSRSVEKELIKVTFFSWNKKIETFTADIYPIKNMMGRCPNFNPKE
jgi:hypothetical protein